MNSLASRPAFKRHLKMALLSTALVCASASTVHAGFEWVPASEAQFEKPPKVEQAPAVNAPVPQQTELSAPVSTPAPVSDLSSASVEVNIAREAPAVSAVNTQKNDMLPLPGGQGAVEPVIKVKNFYEKEQQEEQMAVSKPVPIAALSTDDGVENTIEAPKKPQDVVVKRNVIIPDNAPERAVVKISKKGGEIKAAPDKIELEVVEAAVVPDKPVIENREPAALTQNELLEFAGAPVVGFGTDMPLALALNQIVPSNYAYAFGDGVNPGYRVSWSGGKSWVDVVSDMIQPLNLISEVRGKTVYIRLEKAKKMSAVSSDDVAQDSVDVAYAQETSKVLNEDVSVSVSKRASSGEDDKARKNVIDPGEVAAAQPVKTVDAIENTVRDDVLVAASTPVWEARKGDSLKDTLDVWSKESGVELVWDADYDYRLKNDVSTTGAFENALNMIVGFALEGESVPAVRLVGVSQNADQQAQLIIQDRPQG